MKKNDKNNDDILIFAGFCTASIIAIAGALYIAKITTKNSNNDTSVPNASSELFPPQLSNFSPVSLNLHWYSPAIPPSYTGYNIYRRDMGIFTPGSIFELIASISATSPMYNDGSIFMGHTYEYYITVTNSIGESAPSNIVSISV